MVEIDQGGEVFPLDPAFEVRRHSPTGFEWGYNGSGPAQLALALLMSLTGQDHLAERDYQKFKTRVVAHLPHDVWVLTEEQAWRLYKDVIGYQDRPDETD